MTAVMLDLETMGNEPDSAIIAIGACEFSSAGIGSVFYEVVDLASSVHHGGVITPSTVLWWMDQSEQARAQIRRRGEHITTTLRNFAEWLPAGAEVWGNGAAFDNVILASAYRRLLLPVPWDFWNDRCYRTVKNRSAVRMPERTGTLHNALDDAINQAKHLILIDATVNMV